MVCPSIGITITFLLNHTSGGLSSLPTIKKNESSYRRNGLNLSYTKGDISCLGRRSKLKHIYMCNDKHSSDEENISIHTSNLGKLEKIVQHRGGDGKNCEEEEKSKVKRSSDFSKNVGMSIALFAAHFSVMAAKCSLPSCFALILSPESGLSFNPTLSPQKQMSFLLFLSTLSIATGKICLGPLIDKFGGLKSLKIQLVFLSFLLCMLGFSTKFFVFSACWICIDLCFSACWPGCLASVYETFDSHTWPRKIGMLALAARTGNACAFLGFGSLLQIFAGRSNLWRLIFRVSSLIQLFPLLLLQYFGNSVKQPMELTKNLSINRKESSNERGTFYVLFQEMRTIEFWLILISRSALMIFGNFLLFVPAFMTHGYSLSYSLSSKVASLYAVGCLTSVALFSRFYNDLNAFKQIALVALLCAISCLCAFSQLLHSLQTTTFSPMLGSVIMILWGFSFSVPFYLPPALFALKRGGKESAATIGE